MCCAGGEKNVCDLLASSSDWWKRSRNERSSCRSPRVNVDRSWWASSTDGCAWVNNGCWWSHNDWSAWWRRWVISTRRRIWRRWVRRRGRVWRCGRARRRWWVVRWSSTVTRRGRVWWSFRRRSVVWWSGSVVRWSWSVRWRWWRRVVRWASTVRRRRVMWWSRRSRSVASTVWWRSSCMSNMNNEA